MEFTYGVGLMTVIRRTCQFYVSRLAMVASFSNLRGGLSRTVSMILVLSFCGPAWGHNYVVHRDMADLAYEIMIIASQELGRPQNERLIAGPLGNVTAEQWEIFLNDIQKGRSRIRMLQTGLQLSKRTECISNQRSVGTEWAANKTLGEMPWPVALDWFTGDDCGADFTFSPPGIYAEHNKPSAGNFQTPPQGVDYSGEILGFWAASIDDHVDDTHFYFKPTSILGIGAATTKADELITKGLSIPLIPLFCLFECIFGDCDNCDQNARDFADEINPTDELIGLLPGFGDKSGLDYVGVWHFIGMQGGSPTTFDDRSGYLMEKGGPNGQPDPLVTGLMAGSDLLGMSLNYAKSKGPRQYEISSGSDFHRDTTVRSSAKWTFPPFPHLIFEPADNLAKYGWDRFRNLSNVSAEALAWPLHAIGDATVPMHVVGASGWGHRPFEEAVEDAWPRLIYLTDLPEQAEESRALQGQQAARILSKAHTWRKYILDWRARHPGEETNLPVRDLVTALAQETFDYANSQQPSGWPYDPTASLLFLASNVTAQGMYDNNAAVNLTRPLIENGVAVMLAFLMSAMER